MDKLEALEEIKSIWNNEECDLYKKIVDISQAYYSVGLDVATTAAFIKATPAELDALLALSELDDDVIEKISDLELPETTWPLFASASDEEIRQALKAFEKRNSSQERELSVASEFVYQQMIEVAGPTTDRLVAVLSGNEIAHALKKGADFGALTDKEIKFMKSLVGYKKMGKTFSQKQTDWLISILTKLAEKGAIIHNSIDNDQEICDKILDAIGK